MLPRLVLPDISDLFISLSHWFTFSCQCSEVTTEEKVLTFCNGLEFLSYSLSGLKFLSVTLHGFYFCNRTGVHFLCLIRTGSNDPPSYFRFVVFFLASSQFPLHITELRCPSLLQSTLEWTIPSNIIMFKCSTNFARQHVRALWLPTRSLNWQEIIVVISYISVVFSFVHQSLFISSFSFLGKYNELFGLL